ncbi:MAG: hypothetical protein ACLFPQ_05225 [Candidatus Woesearchaeota archaeon]
MALDDEIKRLQRFEFFRRPNFTEIKEGKRKVIATDRDDFEEKLLSLRPDQYLMVNDILLPQMFRQHEPERTRNKYLHYAETIDFLKPYSENDVEKAIKNMANIATKRMQINNVPEGIIHNLEHKVLDEPTKYLRREVFNKTINLKEFSSMGWRSTKARGYRHNIFYPHDCIEAAKIITWTLNNDDSGDILSVYPSSDESLGNTIVAKIPSRSKKEFEKNNEKDSYPVKISPVPMNKNISAEKALYSGINMETEHSCPYTAGDINTKDRSSTLWDMHSIAAYWIACLESFSAEKVSMFPVPKKSTINLWRNMQRVIVYYGSEEGKKPKPRPMNEAEISRYLMRESIKNYSKYWDNMTGKGDSGKLHDLDKINWKSV